MSNKDAMSMQTVMLPAMQTASDQQCGLLMQRNATQRNATNATTTYVDISSYVSQRARWENPEIEHAMGMDEAMSAAVESVMDLAVMVRLPDHSAFEAAMRLDQASAVRMLLAAACLIDLDETTSQTRARIDAVLTERCTPERAS